MSEVPVATTSIAVAVLHAISGVIFLSFNSSFLIDSLARPRTNLSSIASFKKSLNAQFLASCFSAAMYSIAVSLVC